ncbi:DMT family transporter [Paenibacillus sp. 1011MAR3C5]|uniref:DMT family transporter n=1 Tax=Paenibacillus sp. 1011MAR3C5 TaxID=1675787 RepID=UPI000E6C18B6|nr:DMT family transporter [Paenibacillus sp. 1011MAR3C5]RJE86976.1 DMT family transporter [Paenibacillus sp. 1011MAR3C5]
MIWGIVMAMAAGCLISVQTMFNNKVSLAVSSQTTSALVLGMGLLASFGMGVLMEGRSFFDMGSMPIWYWFSGLLGIGVVTCVVNGVKQLGASYAIAIVMASQLLCALWWDSLGWFGLQEVPLTPQKAIGAVLLIAGLVMYKVKGQRREPVKKAEQVKPHAANG